MSDHYRSLLLPPAEPLDPAMSVEFGHMVDPKGVQIFFRRLSGKPKGDKMMIDYNVENQKDARQVAEDAWLKTQNRDSGVVMACDYCFSRWQANNRQGLRPPRFPSDFAEVMAEYKGRCPDCGQILRHRPVCS